MANASVQTVPAMVERARPDHRRAARPRPRHRGQRLAPHPGHRADRGPGDPGLDRRGRGAHDGARGARLHAARDAGRCSGGPRTLGRRRSRDGRSSSRSSGRSSPAWPAGCRELGLSGVGIATPASGPRCSTSTSSSVTARSGRHRSLGVGQDHALPRRQRPGAAHDRRPDPRQRSGSMARRSTTGRCTAQPAHRHRLPEPGDPAVAGRRQRLRGGRLRADEPRASARRGHRADLGRARDPPDRWPRGARSARLSGGQMQLVAIAGLLAMRPAAPRPRRADGPARPRRDATGRRGDLATGRRWWVDPRRRAEDRPAGRYLHARRGPRRRARRDRRSGRVRPRR